MKFDQLIREGRDTDAVRLMARTNYESGKIGHTRMLLLVRIADELDERRELQEAQSKAIVREQERAEQAERAVERLVNRVIEAEECPGGIPQGQAPCDAESEFYAGKVCATCWHEWAMEEGK